MSTSRDKLLDALETQEALDAQDKAMALSTIHALDNSRLIQELHHRGVTVRDIFARYYELEEQGAALTDEQMGSDEEGQHGRANLTVEDAQIVGLA